MFFSEFGIVSQAKHLINIFLMQYSDTHFPDGNMAIVQERHSQLHSGDYVDDIFDTLSSQ